MAREKRDISREEVEAVLEDLADEGFLRRAGDGYNLNTEMLVKLRARIMKRSPFESRKALVDFVAESVEDLLKTSSFFDGATRKQRSYICEMMALIALEKIHDVGRVGMYL